MIVPLVAESLVTDGRQKVKIWRNGEAVVIDSPLLPYFYSPLEIPMVRSELVKKTLLYETDYSGDIYKCVFRNENDLRKNASKNAWESRVKLIDRLYIDIPEYIIQYPNNNELRILSLDIEVDSFLTFPNAVENAIIAIGIQLNDMPIEIYMAKKHNDDRDLLIEVFKRIKELDPDIIVTYNGIRFDMPYICDRCKYNRISTTWLTRDGTDVEHIEDHTTGEYKATNIGGRVHYDIMVRSVKDGQKVRDQNLFQFNLKHFDMKSVAKAYNCPDVIKESQEVMSNMRSIVNTKQLHDYLESDIRCTTYLRKIYLPAIIKQAENLQVPLNTVVNMTPSYTGSIIFARKFGAIDIVGDMTVGEAHPFLSANKQGAWVQTYRTGLFKDGLRDIDVTSFYPNLILQLNLCPTTTKILRTEDELKPYSTHMTEDNHLQLSIPDERANCQIIIDINMNKQGIASAFVAELMRDRAEIKKRMKTLDKNSPEYADCDANQLNLKIIINSLTGFFGMQYSLFGSLAAYIAITGSGRYLLRQMKDFLDKDEERVIACNTDGIYLTGGPSLDEIHEWLEAFIKEKYFCDKSYIWLEDTPYSAGYFQKNAEKHYLLLTKPDKNGKQDLIIHGGGLKGSAKIPLYSAVIDEIGLKLLTTGVTEADVEKFYNSANWSLEDVTFGRTVKQRDSYKNGGELGVQLIDQYKDRFDKVVHSGTRLNYVKVSPTKKVAKHTIRRKVKVPVEEKTSEYKLVTIFDKLSDVPNLDLDYYKAEVDKALERLDLADLCPKTQVAKEQKSLFDF
ncbi:DNA polymerase domain-containing protein [Bacteroides sp.]|uniref:DNA polymerase domain-containing protein n=1 Tax=Bacteroides sp. TaxID=29523 RepID=UPI00262B16B0|nr:DNA polymerase domain-containing protein [Bacteroides sp.]MDD3039623.1 DNA polymerase domain-containing protein [Bacteroides sp.]